MATEARLAHVPWAALEGLAPLLEQPLKEILDGAAAERVLDRLLRAHREFSREQRAACAESLFGVGLWRRRLRWRLDGTPLQLLAILVRELGGYVGAERALGVELPTLRAESDDWRVRTSFPDWIAEVFTARFGSDAERVANAMNTPGPVCLRARTDRDALKAKLVEKGLEATATRFARKGLVITTPRPNLLGLGLQGEFEVQDEGSQLLGELVGARAGEDVLDLCAGAGGKSLQLASDGARVHATDVDLERLERLRTRASKSNLSVLIHGKEPPARRFDRVLVDAPCSELGVLRRGPDMRWRIDPSILKTLPELQRSLVEKGLSYLKPGGTLVYATCTLTRGENEDVVESILAAHPEVKRARGDLIVDPFHDGTDGFYGAVLVVPSSTSSDRPDPSLI